MVIKLMQLRLCGLLVSVHGFAYGSRIALDLTAAYTVTSLHCCRNEFFLI